MLSMRLLDQPTRNLFFTGKGVVGKTSLSTPVAIHLADGGKQMERIANGLAKHAYVLPWKTKAPIGFEELLAQTVKMAHDEPNPRP